MTRWSDYQRGWDAGRAAAGAAFKRNRVRIGVMAVSVIGIFEIAWLVAEQQPLWAIILKFILFFGVGTLLVVVLNKLNSR